jgi:formylglycine-generating enzyme required for sulfatase activity
MLPPMRSRIQYRPTRHSVADETDREISENRHRVRLTRPFALLDREITWEELIAFHPDYVGRMQYTESSPGGAGAGASWYDCVLFCRWLGEQWKLAEDDQPYASPESLDSERYRREQDPSATWAPRDWPLDLSRRGFRLPTEAEWEIAARSGARTSYSYGSETRLLGRFGWSAENSRKRIHAPKELRSSDRGLFDMHGNLFEWVHDWSESWEGADGQTDPVGPQEGSDRVYRGGGWNLGAEDCRSAPRNSDGPTNRARSRGFRLAMSPSGI